MKSPELWKKRIRMERWIREYFWSLDYEEVRTPLLVMSPGMEPHIRPIEVIPGVFLPTSPEFAMKKLIARGMHRVFQICSSFRDEPRSPEHSPEFTMLEFYEADISLDAFQSRVENLFRFVASKIKDEYGTTAAFHLLDPWPRFTVNELFQKHAGLDLRDSTPVELAARCQREGIPASSDESWDDLYFKIWLNLVEPNLPHDRPCFVTHYPVSQSSLCNRVKDERGFEWANRFECYAGKLELGNAFDELRDPVVQRKNFIHDQQVRAETYGDAYPVSPLDEELLAAIPEMPPTCGIAIGVDRMAMLLLNASRIDQVIPLATHWRKA
jgi:lysyl-tRNA synthetase class 2